MEAVIFNRDFPEGLMAEFYDSKRKFHVEPIYPRKGDMVYGLSFRFRRVLYLRGLATPVKFSDGIKKREQLHAIDVKKFTKGAGRTATITRKKRADQKTILDFFKK